MYDGLRIRVPGRQLVRVEPRPGCYHSVTTGPIGRPPSIEKLCLSGAFYQCRRRDSNPRHADYDRAALLRWGPVGVWPRREIGGSVQLGPAQSGPACSLVCSPLTDDRSETSLSYRGR